MPKPFEPRSLSKLLHEVLQVPATPGKDIPGQASNE